jgi:hypothetical protein
MNYALVVTQSPAVTLTGLMPRIRAPGEPANATRALAPPAQAALLPPARQSASQGNPHSSEGPGKSEDEKGSVLASS